MHSKLSGTERNVFQWILLKCFAIVDVPVSAVAFMQVVSHIRYIFVQKSIMHIYVPIYMDSMINIVYLNNSQIILIAVCYAFIVIVCAAIAKRKYLSNSNAYRGEMA